MTTTVFIAVSCILTAVVAVVWLKRRALLRAEFIRTYMFPPGLLDKFAERRPGFELRDRQLVARALRQFFIAHL